VKRSVKRIVLPALLAIICVGTNVQAQKRNPRVAQAAKKSSPAAAAVWREAYSDADVTVSVDSKKTVRQADSSYSTRLRWTYTKDHPIGRGKMYRSMTETRLVDCEAMRSKSVRATTYDSEGKTVSSYDTKPDDMKFLSWSARKPGSTSANAIEGVCKIVKPS
jgi:hypothetical protein